MNIHIYNTISMVRIISTHLRCQPSLNIAKVVTWRLASCSHVLPISWHFQDSGKGTFFFLLWDQNWCDFFLNTVDTFFIFFHIFLCSSVVVFAPMVGQFFFCGDVFEKVFFCTFWMIQTPCVFCFKKNTSGEMPVTLSAAESAPFPTDLICVYQVAWGELSANKAMKPSQQKSKMDDDWCMMYIYIYMYTLLGTKKIPEEMTFD